MVLIGLWWRLLQRWGISHKHRQHLPCILNNIERLTEYTEDKSSFPTDFNVEVSLMSLTPTSRTHISSDLSVKALMKMVAEVWKLSVRLLTRNSPQLNGGGGNKSALWKWRSLSGQPKRTVMWTWVCGFMLFTLGVISLFTGHVVSHLEWYSQQLSKRSLLVPFLKLQLSALLDFSLGFCSNWVFEIGYS